MDSECIFCKIANEQIASYTVYENDMLRVILDRFPASKGHLLIIPKVHAENIYELDEELAAEIFKLAVKFSKVIKKTYNIDGLNIVQNNGKIAGQTVFHFHLHIIPRTESDEIKIGWKSLKLDEMEFENIFSNIIKNVQ